MAPLVEHNEVDGDKERGSDDDAEAEAHKGGNAGEGERPAHEPNHSPNFGGDIHQKLLNINW